MVPYKIDYNRLKENITFFIGKEDFQVLLLKKKEKKVQQLEKY